MILRRLPFAALRLSGGSLDAVPEKGDILLFEMRAQPLGGSVCECGGPENQNVPFPGNQVHDPTHTAEPLAGYNAGQNWLEIGATLS